MSADAHFAPASDARRRDGTPFSRFSAMFMKEFIQLRRDRVTFATMIMIPLLQIVLFGFAINTTPHNLPAAVLLHEQNYMTRSVLGALRNTEYFDFAAVAHSEAEVDSLIRSGKVLFAIEIPAGFERAVRRGDKPAILIIADATDPVASGTALAALEGTIQRAVERDRLLPPDAEPEKPFEFRQHRRYNPAGVTRLNIVPGLLGTILTMTMLIFTALSVTREVERGTMESLLAMPIRPVELMLGKIAPYIFAGALQAAIIFAAGWFFFSVPVVGSYTLLTVLSLLFIAANLSIGYTFSTIARNQLQAIQMSFMFFLPNILLSGFMFPFAGMPRWAQWIGEALPLTHFLRIVRGIMLKGADFSELAREIVMLLLLMLVAMTIAVTRFRRTLD
ncbi:MAG: ABC transporter permease [Flavobacteriaceae bacterium]